MRLEGKSVIVTGGASGIGRAIALCMAKEGGDICIPDINLDGAQKVAKEVEGLGRKALALKCDVAKVEEVEAMVKRTLETFGKIDILVNNTGIDLPVGMPFTNNTEEDWDRGYQINVKSMVLTCKAVAPHMMERRFGKIINLASIAGQLGSATSAPYSVSKGAVITLTRCFARDLAPYGINVNAICPGLLWTPFWQRLGEGLAKSGAFGNLSPREIFDKRTKEWVPMQREQIPEDIGWAAVFLASDEARNITGQSLNVDGGVYMH
ncbi:MAG: 3-oxoacyl-ACP reductase FabG [candidate division NC10 bacterium]|nr:3-oxoacyl-ACP reductase FabG [candidate division NC10 bacterium]